MPLNESWIIEHIVEEKYLDLLKRNYPQHDLQNLLLLNIDLRLLYLKHILMIENSLKYALLQQLLSDNIQNVNNTTYLNPDHLEQMKTALHLIRAGYNKYGRSGVLKSRTIRSLLEVMSFEWTMSLLQTLNHKSIAKIAHYFGIKDFNDRKILLEQLEYIKDVRNYLSHNFKVLGVQFKHKERFAYYEQALNATNEHHYLHLLIDRFSSKNELLPRFNSDYEKLFKNYEVKIHDCVKEQTDTRVQS
ncbi:Abi family protein [Spiroplasma endosymbiont of Nebria brevicollis]|uniref:Abi family protein n=1 Tax=Spiroplasma endosymbiont of Nebria brevicollis TaxID=3066284 RepID=UPI00313DA945